MQKTKTSCMSSACVLAAAPVSTTRMRPRGSSHSKHTTSTGSNQPAPGRQWPPMWSWDGVRNSRAYSALSLRAWWARESSERQLSFRALSLGPRLALNEKSPNQTEPNQRHFPEGLHSCECHRAGARASNFLAICSS